MTDALVTYKLEAKFTPAVAIWLQQYAKADGMTVEEFLLDKIYDYVKATMPLCRE